MLTEMRLAWRHPRPGRSHLMLDTARRACPAATLIAAGDGQGMFVELSVMEQRYHAVMEVVSGAAL